jgi:hypothetical protein
MKRPGQLSIGDDAGSKWIPLSVALALMFARLAAERAKREAA